VKRITQIILHLLHNGVTNFWVDQDNPLKSLTSIKSFQYGMEFARHSDRRESKNLQQLKQSGGSLLKNSVYKINFDYS